MVPQTSQTGLLPVGLNVVVGSDDTEGALVLGPAEGAGEADGPEEGTGEADGPEEGAATITVLGLAEGSPTGMVGRSVAASSFSPTDGKLDVVGRKDGIGTV